MQPNVLSVFIALTFLLTTPASLLRAQPKDDSWILLLSAVVDGKVDQQALTLPSGTERTSALRLAVKDGPIELTRVVVTYGNGQVHFESNPIRLRPGERSKAIDQREEALIVETVTLSFQVGGSARQSLSIEIWGLKPTRSASAPGSGGLPGFRPRDVPSEPGTSGEPKRRYVEVPVFFGTTRQKEADRVKNGRNLATFSGEQGRDLLFGRSMVTVPIERDPGTIPRPEKDLIITRIAFRNEDPNRDFTIAAVDVMSKDAFLGEMKKQVALSTRYKGQAFVFVHGYNVGFDDAIFRTAQIAHDIVFDGPAVAFSWPSRGGMWDYRHDIDTAKGSREGLRTLLETLAREIGVSAINLVAHSMGNDPVVEVLREQAEITLRHGQTQDFKLNEIVLAAPDVSRKVFEQFAVKFVGLAKGGITLYASKNDRAMAASKQVAGGLVRAGDVPKDGIVIVPGIESIDISDASTSFLSSNHSTFADREHLVADMRLLFERVSAKHPPDLRFPVYRSVGTRPKQWWRYRKN